MKINIQDDVSRSVEGPIPAGRVGFNTELIKWETTLSAMRMSENARETINLKCSINNNKCIFQIIC